MEWLKKPWVKLGIRISGFLFLIGATAFTIAYFTTDIPDPNDYPVHLIIKAQGIPYR